MVTTNRPDNLMKTLQSRLRFLYETEHPTAHRFRYALLVFDAATILFIVASSFFERTPLLEAIDVLFGLVILADFAARLLISRTRIRDLLQPATWADWSPSPRSSRRSPAKAQASSGCFERCGFCTPTSCSRACAPTAHGFAATRN